MGSAKKCRLLILVVFLSSICGLWYGQYAWRQYQSEKDNQISYSAFVGKVNSGSILRVKIAGDQITAEGTTGHKFQLFLPAGADLPNLLLSRNVDFSSKPPGSQPKWLELSIILIVAVFLFLILR